MIYLNRRKVGDSYEVMALEFLEHHGVTVIEKNFRNRYGEIDLVVQDQDYLVFVEVKFRANLKKGSPLEAVNQKKQIQIRKIARDYLYSHHLGENIPCRFDVVAILGEEISWIKNAF